MKKYYQLEVNGREAEIYIFGDITSREWFESDVSSYTLSKDLQGLDVDTINVHINSYGGEVAEGLAIYNLLRSHKAKVRIHVDGFAASIASVIAMAGDERIMSEASLMFIHNAWTVVAGNADQLRKEADDLEKITQASVNAYLARVNITEEELKAMLNAETWILPDEALQMGFATAIVAEEKTEKVAASARKALFSLLAKPKAEAPPVSAEPPAAAEPEEEEPVEAEASVEIEPPVPESADPPENKTLKFLNAL